MKVNLRLKAKIIERFGTQAQFAKTLRIQESMVSEVVRGRRNLTEDEKNAWLSALGGHSSDLFGENFHGNIKTA